MSKENEASQPESQGEEEAPANQAEEPKNQDGELPMPQNMWCVFDRAMDPIPFPKRRQQTRLRKLVREILRFNPLEFMDVSRRLQYTIFNPKGKDMNGHPMALKYASLVKRYGDWYGCEAMPVVPVEPLHTTWSTNVEPDMIVDEPLETEKFMNLLKLEGEKKVKKITC